MMKGNGSHKQNQIPPGGKPAFSLKQKSKLATPAVKFGDDDDDYDKDAASSSGGPVKRQKLARSNTSGHSSKPVDFAPPPPSDPTVREVADSFASFVAKNGRQLEQVFRQKSSGDTPLKFLFDESCPDYKYYEYRLAEEEKASSQARDIQKQQSELRTLLGVGGRANITNAKVIKLAIIYIRYLREQIRILSVPEEGPCGAGEASEEDPDAENED